MKIIFETEQQKNFFAKNVASLLCPGDVILDDAHSINKGNCTGTDLCENCWKEYVEMEVKNENNI